MKRKVYESLTKVEKMISERDKVFGKEEKKNDDFFVGVSSLFIEQEDIVIRNAQGFARTFKIHDITHKDLVIKNASWLALGSTVTTFSKKDEEEPKLVELKVKKRCGNKTYLRPIVENTTTIKNKRI